MSVRPHISVGRVTPDVPRVLAALGMPDLTAASRHVPLAQDAIELYRKLAAPTGMWRPIDRETFARVYEESGEHAEVTPVADVYPHARALALFAVTVGDRVSKAIEELFAADDFALGAMLDAAASEGAEMAADELERAYGEHLGAGDHTMTGMGLMRFSPGYCGWPTSGQKSLFAQLQPADIGIELSASCLMHPLKSVSGVLIAGPGETFQFGDDFAFCDECETHSCRERLAALHHISPGNGKEGPVL